MENTLVWCKTKAEVREVLSEAKNMGYHMSDLDDYTERFWSTHESETVINLHGDGKGITYCYKDWYINHPNFGKIISASKFFGRKPILITRKGRVVTAENKNTGEKAIATCCPTDTFDFGTGAMIAVARLIAQSDKGITKDAETVLRQLLGYDAEIPADDPTEAEPKPFKVGDLVTLREGVKEGDHFGHLDVECGAMFDQSHHKPIKVIEITKAGSYYCTPADGNGTGFYYHEGMLELWDESKIREGDKVHVKKGCTKDRYDTYYQWLKDNISDIDLLLGFERKDSVSTTDTYTVVKIAPHEYFGGTQLAFIKKTNGIGDTFSYLYDIDSLEKVTE